MRWWWEKNRNRAGSMKHLLQIGINQKMLILKQGTVLHQFLVFKIHFFNDTLYCFADMTSGFFVKIFGIYRFAVFDDHMRFFDLRQVVFEDCPRVVDAHRYDGASSLFGNFKTRAVEF